MSFLILFLAVAGVLAGVWVAVRWSRRAPAHGRDAEGATEVEEIATAWERACLGAGLVRTVETVTGNTIIPPKIVHVVLGPPTMLTVRLEPGQTTEDVCALAHRLAPHMGAYSLRAESRGSGDWCVVTLLPADPLAEVFPLPDGPTTGPVVLAVNEDGSEVLADPDALGHVAVQGATGSGKSGWLYALLAQLAERARCGYPLSVSGVDPSGLLLRPWAGNLGSSVPLGGRGNPGYHASVLGLRDPAEVEHFLTAAVADMDERVAAMPADRDTLPSTADHPLRFVVLEEYPGLLRWLDATDTKQSKRCRALVARLLAEGRKAGIRVVLVAQRAEASVIGGTERGQCDTRITFRVDNRDAVALLHPDADAEIAARHASELPGVALLSAPGRPLSRVRSPWIGGFAEYVRRVEGVTA